jgi:hypothetical protein
MRYGLRVLRRAPDFSAAAILILALGTSAGMPVSDQPTATLDRELLSRRSSRRARFQLLKPLRATRFLGSLIVERAGVHDKRRENGGTSD